MKRAFLALLLSFSAVAFAQQPEVGQRYEDEATAGCKLARDQAEVSAAVAIAPSAFVSAGNQLGQKTMAVGISQSLSGIVRAHDIRASAEAQCDSFQSSTRLDKYAYWAILDVQKRGAVSTIKSLNNAIDAAQANVEIFAQQVKSGVSAVNDVDAAALQLSNLQKEKALVLASMSITIPIPMDFDNLSQLVKEYEIDQGRAAELTAKALSHGGWDFTIAAGENKPIGGQPEGTPTSMEPFITAQVKYSFGYLASSRAAHAVAKDTEDFLSVQQIGYGQSLTRNQKQVQMLIEAENSNVKTFAQALDTLKKIRQPLEDVQSVLGANARRTLDIQIASTEADLAGATTRLDGFKDLLRRMR